MKEIEEVGSTFPGALGCMFLICAVAVAFKVPMWIAFIAIGLFLMIGSFKIWRMLRDKYQ